MRIEDIKVHPTYVEDIRYCLNLKNDIIFLDGKYTSRFGVGQWKTVTDIHPWHIKYLRFLNEYTRVKYSLPISDLKARNVVNLYNENVNNNWICFAIDYL